MGGYLANRPGSAAGTNFNDSNTIAFTVVGTDVSAEVISQMSITADASGIKLVGDEDSPGNLQYYGTDGSGVKGFYSIPVGATPDWYETDPGEPDYILNKPFIISGSNTILADLPVATGEGATAIGFYAVANGDYTNAFGYVAGANAEGSTAIGSFSAANGTYSTAVGGGVATGNSSFALGNSANAIGLTSSAIGPESFANGDSSLTAGPGVVAESWLETAYGSYNTNYTPASTSTWDVTDRNFSIGNGFDGSNRSNIMTGLKIGYIGTLGIETPTAFFHLTASTTAAASLRIPAGTAPTAPNDGDVWTDADHIYARLDGVTYQLDQQGGGGSVEYNDILDPTANTIIDFTGFTNVWTAADDGGVMFRVSNTAPSLTVDTTLLQLTYDINDSNGRFLECVIDPLGTPNTVFLIGRNGEITSDAGATFGDSVDVPGVSGFTVGSSIPFSDTAGVLTLQNIDVLDATTETTIENAIDTLPNLTAASSLVTVGTLTGGATGAGFTIALGASTITGDLPFANLTQIAGFSILAKADTGTGDVAALTAAADGVLRRSGSGDLAFGSLVTNNYGNNSVTYGKLQQATAYKFPANNTGSTANLAENNFHSPGQQVLPSGNLTWTAGAAPSSTYNGTYSFTWIGNCVQYVFTINYAVAGTTITALTIAFPSDMPAPIEPTGFTAGGDALYPGRFLAASNKQRTGLTQNATAFLMRDAGDTAYEFQSNIASGTYNTFYFFGRYFTA